MSWKELATRAEIDFQSLGGVAPQVFPDFFEDDHKVHEYSEDAPVLPMPIENDEPEKPAIPEKSFWHSKIFWVQSVTLLAAVLGGFGLDISPEYQRMAIEVITGVMGGTSLLTIMFRVFFTSTRIKAVRRR